MNDNMLGYILCPVCKNGSLVLSDKDLLCIECNYRSTVKDSVVDLRMADFVDTKLNIEMYDDLHNISLENSYKLYKVYSDLIKEYSDLSGERVLEVASGSGNLSRGIVQYSSCRECYFTDISFDFMSRLKKGLPSTNKILKFFLFDANTFPFVSNHFDLVVGNSVLHHFSHFENTILESFRVVKDGGVAIFGEPVLDAHVFVSLCAQLIVNIEKYSSVSILNDAEIRVLTVLSSRSKIKMQLLRSDRSELRNIEDKFYFPISYMRNLATKVGFKNFECVSVNNISNFSDIIKDSIKKVFIQNRLDSSKIDHFNFIFESLEDAYVSPKKEDMVHFFSFFVFKK